MRRGRREATHGTLGDVTSRARTTPSVCTPRFRSGSSAIETGSTSRRSRVFPRTAAALTALALGAALTSCSDAEAKAAPEPHLAALYTQALADAAAFSSSGYAQVATLRTAQAAALADEIDRVCGTNANGQHPENCSAEKVNVDALGMGSAAEIRATIATGTVPASSAAAESQDALGARIDAAESTTIDALTSVDLSGQHAVDAGILTGVLAGLGAISHGAGLGTFPAAALADSAPLVPAASSGTSASSAGNTDGSSPTSNPGDGASGTSGESAAASGESAVSASTAHSGESTATNSSAASTAITGQGRTTQKAIDAATELLEQEYRTLYFLAVSTGIVDDSLSSTVLEAARTHRTIRDQVITWLKNNGVAEAEIPAAATAYTLNSGLSTSGDAVAVIQSIELDTAASAYRFAQAATDTAGLWTAVRASYTAAALGAHIGTDGGATPLADTAGFALPGRAA